jgi:UDP-N-acetyl-D-glucosamine dehydrogenase
MPFISERAYSGKSVCEKDGTACIARDAVQKGGSFVTSLVAKLKARSAHLVVSGVGYVGLPLAVEFARAGFRVTGLDTDAEKMRALERGEAYVPDVANETLRAALTAKRLRGTTDPRVLAKADAVLVCVPTPLKEAREPDIRHIVEATDAIARHQHPDMLVALESTTYPGTTAEVLVPRLAARFALGEEVFVAYSPERVDPGNRAYGPRNTPKVIAGATPRCLEAASALYGAIVETLVPVSSTTTAEMVKVLENTFRAVNVGLVNEIALMSRKLGVDAFEVVRAAATKPFGFMPFFPGPGVGGHCIPLDPLYLSWKLERLDYRARFIELADAVNRAMPEYVVGRVMEALNDAGKPLRGSRVLVYGVAYKRDVADTRESPALAILDGLAARGARVSYSDPFVPELAAAAGALQSVDASAPFSAYEAVVIVTDHAALDRQRLLREARLIIDTRNALAGCEGRRDHVHGL